VLDTIAVVDPYPPANEKTEVLHWEEQAGGPAATAMVTLARLGIPAALAGIVGDDEAGERIRKLLAASGIDLHLATRPGLRSQTAFIAVEKNTAKRTIFWRRAEGRDLRIPELPAGFPERFSFLHLDGLMEGISTYACRKARASGIPVMLDAGRIRKGTLAIAAHCDYLVGSETSARQLGWTGNRRRIGRIFREKVLALGIRAATFTLGERGSFTVTPEGMFFTPAFRIKPVDTNGAGDVFHGAYIYGLLQHWPLPRVVEFASAVAAMKCTKIGGQAGIPGIRAVRQFLARTSGIPELCSP
jgi:sulfofructose kinase